MSNDDEKSKIIKLGLISQSSIDVYNIFSTFFEKEKLSYNIRDQNHYEFNLKNTPDLTILLNHFKENIDNTPKYIDYKFFLIFINIEDINSLDYLDKIIENIFEANNYNNNKKYYIFGFFENNEKYRINEEKLFAIMDSIGIDYIYYKIKNNDFDSFKYNIKFIINDCNTIMTEQFLELKHNELVDDSHSKCYIF